MLAAVTLAVAVTGVTTLHAAPTVRVRDLCIQAPVVVLAVPLDPVAPVKFRVSSVLHGKGLSAGDEVAPTGIDAAQVRTFDPPNVVEGSPRPRRVAHALLFLEPSAGGGWTLLRGGFRFCTDDGRTLVPTGEQAAVELDPATRWPLLVRRVRDDVADVDQLLGYRRIGRPQRRAQALLGWVRERRGEFTASTGGTEEAPVGYDRLHQEVFDWIFAAAAPDDAWAAVSLYAELNHGELPQLRAPTFAHPAGRAFLARCAADESRLLGERTRALRLLALPAMLWPEAAEMARGATPLDSKEQEALLDGLAPLLEVRDDAFRAALARTILAISWPEAPALADRRTGRAVAPLSIAYKVTQPGPARDELAFALAALMPGSAWKELTGNPPAVVACMRDLDLGGARGEGPPSPRPLPVGATVTFWLSLRTPGPAVHEAPLLVVEKLGTFGFVSQTTRVPLTVLNLENGWTAGWNGGDMLAVKADLGPLTPATLYRLRVEGFVGRGTDRQKWTSEPKKLHIPAAAKKAAQGTYRSIPHINQ